MTNRKPIEYAFRVEPSGNSRFVSLTRNGVPIATLYGYKQFVEELRAIRTDRKFIEKHGRTPAEELLSHIAKKYGEIQYDKLEKAGLRLLERLTIKHGAVIDEKGYGRVRFKKGKVTTVLEHNPKLF